MEAPESLEALQARHRKEQRDLVSRITQKKKQATKKTRKGVNDECERLDRELKERQEQEVAIFNGENVEEPPLVDSEPEASDDEEQANGVEKAVGNLTISQSHTAPATQPSPQEQQQNGDRKKKPNRAKARLARRAAEQEALVAQAKEEAANMPDLREQEHTRMASHFDKYGLQLKEIRADGHCLYSAVADQLDNRGLGLKPRIQPTIVDEEAKKLPEYKKVRYAAAEFIEKNPNDFVPFMEEPLPEYLQKIRDTGEWGGHMELIALAKTYGVKINVLHGDGRVDKIEPGEGNDEDKEIWLGYYKHSHGLGEHYNSLRKSP